MPDRADETYDVAIIGGGPAGLNAGLMLGRACRRVVLIDDGQPRNAMARELHGFLTRDGTKPADLLHAGRRELEKYGVEIVTDRVEQIDRRAASGKSRRTSFSVGTRGGRLFEARKLIFATGVRDALPDLAGLRECYGATVHHCPYCDGWEHRGKHLLACGGSSKDAAGLGLALRTWSPRVTVLTNGLASRDSDAADLGRCEVVLVQEKILSLRHEGDQLRGVELETVGFIAADALFFNTRQQPACDLARTLGCDTDDDCLGRTTERKKTNVPGVYIAGDADADVQFVIVAAAEGATAAVAINRELQEEDHQLSASSS